LALEKYRHVNVSQGSSVYESDGVPEPGSRNREGKSVASHAFYISGARKALLRNRLSTGGRSGHCAIYPDVTSLPETRWRVPLGPET
jgi:hypothetical protein